MTKEETEAADFRFRSFLSVNPEYNHGNMVKYL